MKIVLGGIRGSFPIAQAGYVQYGGETTSVLIEGRQGERVLIDLGTGVRSLGERLQKEKTCAALVLLTHYHLDHIIGLPSLPLIYRRKCRVEFAAPVRNGRTIDEVLPRLLADPFWPLQLHTLDSDIVFTTLAEDGLSRPREYGGLVIRWAPVHHQAGCTAYRIDEPASGASMVFATDVEWPLSTPQERERFMRLMETPKPARALFFDGHFTPEEYPDFTDWGHSSWQDAVEVALDSGAGHLYVIHHSQYHDDAALARIDAAVRRAHPDAEVAREGSEIEPVPA